MLIAEFGTGQVLWSIVWLSIFALQIFLIIMVFGEIVQAPYLSGVAKAMWTAVIIFLPYLGILLFLIVHGGEMRRRSQGGFMTEEEAYATGQVSYYTDDR
jgi:hypothetical protein